ncbi:MAG TPA: AbrB family transcriptional regulator [Xanthobacteraceae bacterium]|jgi:membrane AbrB-like protein
MRKFSAGVHNPLATIVTLAVAATGGALLALVGVPAAWLSGALVAVTALALTGFPAHVPNVLRRATFLVLGISMGTAVTPETIAGVRTWPVTMAFLVLSVPATMAAVVAYLRRAGWDREAGLYASAPGALSSVLALAHEAGVDVRRVAFAQSVRVFLLIAALPGLLSLFEPSAASGLAFRVTFTGGDLGEIVLMASAGVAVGLVAERLAMPGGLIVGSMAASAALHATGYVSARMPQYALIPCFVVLGALIGVRFIGTDLALLRRLLFDSVGAFVVAVLVTGLFALGAATLAGEGLGKTVVAFAPGALEGMIILAFLLDLDPAFVAAHHLIRFLLIALLLPFAARLLFGRRAKP